MTKILISYRELIAVLIRILLQYVPSTHTHTHIYIRTYIRACTVAKMSSLSQNRKAFLVKNGTYKVRYFCTLSVKPHSNQVH